MPFQNGVYVPANAGSPMERLYGFQKRQAEMEEMRRQQDLLRQRQQILSESYQAEQPGMAAVYEMQVPELQTEDAGAGKVNLGGMFGADFQAPQREIFAQQDAKPASFDKESAINRLYGVGDLEGASALVGDEYKSALSNRAAGGGASEKWYGNSKTIKGPDGKLYNQLLSSAGNVKLVPVDGDLTGELKQMDLGGRKVWVNSYTGQPVVGFDVGLTPDQANDANPELQGKIAEAKAAGAERGDTAAKGQAAAESSLPVYDKTLGIIDELINHPGRAWGTGGSALLNVAPGTPGYDFKTKLSQLSGQNFLTEIQRMKGQGSLSDAEGKRLSSASAAIDAAQSEDEFLRQLMQLQSELQFYKQRAERKASQGAETPAQASFPGGMKPRQPAQARPAPKVMPSMPNPAQHKGRIVRDTKSGIRYQSNGSQWMRVQ